MFISKDITKIINRLTLYQDYKQQINILQDYVQEVNILPGLLSRDYYIMKIISKKLLLILLVGDKYITKIISKRLINKKDY